MPGTSATAFCAPLTQLGQHRWTSVSLVEKSLAQTGTERDKATTDDTKIFCHSFFILAGTGSFVQTEFLEQLGVTRVFDHVD